MFSRGSFSTFTCHWSIPKYLHLGCTALPMEYEDSCQGFSPDRWWLERWDPTWNSGIWPCFWHHMNIWHVFYRSQVISRKIIPSKSNEGDHFVKSHPASLPHKWYFSSQPMWARDRMPLKRLHFWISSQSVEHQELHLNLSRASHLQLLRLRAMNLKFLKMPPTSLSSSLWSLCLECQRSVWWMDLCVPGGVIGWWDV